MVNDKGAAGTFNAPDALFARDFNEALVHQIVVAFQANARLGTRAQKDRGAVNHSTKKPWRQKGTGRARAGMTSSPLWRGGGRIFPNSPEENFTQKINKKMYRAGMASIFSQLAREGRLAVVDSIKVDSPKTKQLAARFKAMNLDSVLAACEHLPDIGITSRRTAISTVGWIPGIERLATQPRPLRLALSLHAADPALRSELMPVNDRYPLDRVLAACRDYYERKRRHVFVEYVMLAGVNDSVGQAKQLADVLDPRAYKVNLIPYNPTGAGFRGSSRKAIAAFRDTLEHHGVRATVRLTRGRDIDAACGQLAAAG